MEKIKFKMGSSSPFFTSLDEEVQKLISTNRTFEKAKRLLWLKMIFYFLVHLASYLLLYLAPHSGAADFVLNYIFIGMSGLLLAFNVSHDACHETFSKNKKVNYLLYHLTFNMQGTNAYLWKLRHNSSHHVFPNVDGCDADIDNNPMIRLSPQHPQRPYQRFQHIYSILIYCCYTLHWLLFKDILYLFKKKVANLKNIKHSFKELALFIFWKLAYLSALVFIPIWMGYPAHEILLAFFVMHIVDSLFFIHFLIATHLCMETQFPAQGQDGYLPLDYYQHQLATSLDYSPTSRFCNLFLGGFNAHAAHHLYPRLPHTLYPKLSVIIEQKAKEFNVPYHKLSLFEAIRSHYRYLKMMGAPIRMKTRIETNKCNIGSCGLKKCLTANCGLNEN